MFKKKDIKEMEGTDLAWLHSLRLLPQRHAWCLCRGRQRYPTTGVQRKDTKLTQEPHTVRFNMLNVFSWLKLLRGGRFAGKRPNLKARFRACHPAGPSLLLHNMADLLRWRWGKKAHSWFHPPCRAPHQSRPPCHVGRPRLRLFAFCQSKLRPESSPLNTKL